MALSTLWHNPRCSTSRKALALLEARGITPKLRLYLQDPPSRTELADLGIAPARLLRWKDAPDLAKDMPEDAVLDLLAQRPELIERPVFVHGHRAALGRPAEAVLEIL